MPAASETSAVVSRHTFDESNTGEVATVDVGDRISLRLVENPTTGYSWDMSVPEGLVVTSDEFIVSDTGLMGAPGMHVWEIEAAVTGAHAIVGKYIRSWETDVEPAATFSLTVVVE